MNQNTDIHDIIDEFINEAQFDNTESGEMTLRMHLHRRCLNANYDTSMFPLHIPSTITTSGEFLGDRLTVLSRLPEMFVNLWFDRNGEEIARACTPVFTICREGNGVVDSLLNVVFLSSDVVCDIDTGELIPFTTFAAVLD